MTSSTSKRKFDDMCHDGNKEIDRKIIIAIDFGTTYSGVAWSQTAKPDVQLTIQHWPSPNSNGIEGVSMDKVPTEIEYIDGHQMKWGFQIFDTSQRLQWFKLGLDPSQYKNPGSLARNYPDRRAAPPGYNSSPEKAVTDYLKALRKHTELVMAHKVGSRVLESMPFEYIITIPAIWSDAAKAKTLSCATAAGMGETNKLHVISEPEAAALYALNIMDPHELSVGDTFVLCDAGGGTVDLISYAIKAVAPTLVIEEAAAGTGSLCGSTFLDRIFEERLRLRLENEEGWDDGVLTEASKNFETIIKQAFTGSEGEIHKVSVSGMADNKRLGIHRGRLSLRVDEVEEIYRPVVKEILGLLKDQIRSTKTAVKAILLVGGFGQSQYLREKIRATFKDANISVLQSPHGWTAVVRGALMRGLAESSTTHQRVRVEARVARKHYGIVLSRTYHEGVHDKSKRYWDDFDGEYRVEVMKWFANKGKRVEESNPSKIQVYEDRLASKGRFPEVTITIWSCSHEEAPMYQGDGVIELCNVTLDLNCIPPSRLVKKDGKDGQRYLRIYYSLHVTYYSAHTNYELACRKRLYGSVDAEYV